MAYFSRLRFTSGARDSFSSPKSTWSQTLNKRVIPLARTEARMRDSVIGQAHSICHTVHIHRPCAVSCPSISIDWSVCLLVCQILLETVCLFLPGCVLSSSSIYWGPYLSFGLSIDKSIHQCMRVVSISLCLGPLIHLEFCSVLPSLPHLSWT